MNRSLEEQMRGMIVNDNICLGLASTSNLPACNEGQSSLFDEMPRQGIYDSRVLFGGSVIRQIRRIQRKSHSAFSIFQVPLAQNNQNTKTAYLGVAYSATLQPLRSQ